MGFNSTTGSEAGKISKRGKSLNIDLRNDLKTLITHILKDLDYNTLNNSQKLKLLDIKRFRNSWTYRGRYAYGLEFN